MRVGMGFDIHRLVVGRPLFLGGVKIPHAKGPLGHSDADVLLHALCDALLGAVGAGDIGTYFPDSNPRWENAHSGTFVEKAISLAKKKRLAISNVDLVVVTEAPKLAAHRQRIQASIAKLLQIPQTKVNVKAKTMEGLGPIGKGQAIGSYAVVLLE